MSVGAKEVMRGGVLALGLSLILGAVGCAGAWATVNRPLHLLLPDEPVEVQGQATFLWQGQSPPEDCALRFRGERVAPEAEGAPLSAGGFDGIRYASVLGFGEARLDGACFSTGSAWASHPEGFEGLCMILVFLGFSGAGVAFKVAFFGALFGAKRSPGLDAPGMAADTHRRT